MASLFPKTLGNIEWTEKRKGELERRKKLVISNGSNNRNIDSSYGGNRRRKSNKIALYK